MKNYQTTLSQSAKSCFDLASLQQAMNEKRSNGQLPPQTTQLIAFAGVLWSRTESLSDQIYSYITKINTLSTFLSRRSVDSAQNFLLDYIVKEIQGILGTTFQGINSYFWQELAACLDWELKNATRAANFLLQVLQAGYPKLLRIFSDLFSRIRLVTGHDGFQVAFTTITLSSFESAYVSRSITRMLDLVGDIIGKNNVNREDAQRLVRNVSSELNAVRFDSLLLLEISKNIEKAMNSFRGKVDALLHHDIPFSISGSTPKPVQLQKIDAINSLYVLSEGFWALVLEYEGTSIEPILGSITEVSTLSISFFLVFR
jgi:hypothetical protein